MKSQTARSANVLLGLLGHKAVWAGIGASLAAVPLFIAWRAYSSEVDLFFPARRPLTLSLEQSGIANIEAVEFESSAGILGGWYAPPRNGATIILCHGAGGDRTQLLAEAKALTDVGFGALMFDWPGHGASEGTPTWHETERRSLAAVIDWLARRTGQGPSKLGALGFSLGGYILAQVSKIEPRLEAMALVGTPSNLNDQVRLTHQKFALLRAPAARWALTRHGINLNEPQPEQVISAYGPRPLLIVGGTQDITVPPQLTQRLFDVALDPKTLYFVPGAGHGNYVQIASDAYLTRIVSFFEKALLTPPVGQ